MEDIEKPVGDFIIENTDGSYMTTNDGHYYHYSDVCKMLRKYALTKSEESDSLTCVRLSLPSEEEISSMTLELDCPTPNESEYTTEGFKAGVRWLKAQIESNEPSRKKINY